MNTVNVPERINYLTELAPMIQEALPYDAMIGIADTETLLLYLPAKNLNLGVITGQPLPESDVIYKAIKTKQAQFDIVPSEAFGIPFKAKGVPIKDNIGNVIGGLGIGVSLDNQDKLSDLSRKFSSTSEEISASVQEISASSNELAQFIESLYTSQKEMIDQFNKTEDILKFINQVARNSRILGLNAGIEAARSGEHGKGFGVVAKEITKLADSSAKSVDEISNLIMQLKEKVDYIAETVIKTKGVSIHQSEATEEIATAINVLAVASEEIEELAKRI